MGVVILVPQLLGEEKRFPIAIVTAAKKEKAKEKVSSRRRLREGERGQERESEREGAGEESSQGNEGRRNYSNGNVMIWRFLAMK